MKKGTTTLLILAAAGAAAYFFLRKRGAGAEAARTVPDEEPEAETPAAATPDAAVTAPPGRFFEALDKAKEVASTIKDAVVTVKSGTKKAVVRTGKKKKRVCGQKRTRQDFVKFIKERCDGTTGRDKKACRKKARRDWKACTTFIIPETQKAEAF
jgi:hypothetical protein